jgi:zinc transport system permease protein
MAKWSRARPTSTGPIATMDDFLIYALAAGLALAVVAGPLGSFVIWRRMAYFGDTLSHAALLGVALGLALDVSPALAVTVGCLLLAVILVTLQQRQPLASDTLLGILAPTTLSLGLVALSFMRDVRIDLMGYLFGDLLAMSATDLYWILGGSAVVLGLLAALWRPLIAITVHEELARVEGLPVAPLRLALMLLIAIVIAVAMKIVGVLLITSLLIIPAAAAQRHARSPEQMALGASLLGVVAVGAGLAMSWFKDTPAGPSIVVCAGALFLFSYALPRRT